MLNQRQRVRSETKSIDTPGAGSSPTAIEGILIRNHDQERAYTCRITLRDPYGDSVCDRTVTVQPEGTTSLETRLKRGVYRVEAFHDTGTTASADCLIGADPAEHATIETGNGAISVTDGQTLF
jgi:hypothetical protein